MEVAETCQLALQRMEWFNKNSSSDKVSPFHSVDPTPPSSERNVTQLKSVLVDENESLFERYRAMFGLRNIKTDESVLALCEGKLTWVFIYSLHIIQIDTVRLLMHRKEKSVATF